MVNQKQEAREKSYSLHSKISENYRSKIKKMSLKYGSIQKVIEEAVDLLQVKCAMEDKFEKEKIERSTMDEYRLSHLMLNDFKMMAVGRRTFLSYIESIPDAPIHENNAVELIEWFYDHKFHITALSLFQILDAIKKLWIAGNYFTGCQIQALDGDKSQSSKKFKVIFTHDFNGKKYGLYWSKYFTYVLSNPPNDFIVSDLVVRNQSFYFFVQETQTRKPEHQ